MADFVAHYDARKKGHSFEVAESALSVMRMSGLRELGLPVSSDQARAAIKGYAARARDRLSPSARATLKHELESICASVKGHNGQQWLFEPELTSDQLVILQEISRIRLKSAFDQASYAAQLRGVLIASGAAFSPDQMKANSPAARLMMKHAVIRLHGATLKLPDNEKVKLTAQFGDDISIGASIPFHTPDKDLFIGFTLVETNLDPSRDCAPPLDTGAIRSPNFPLDLKAGKIVLLL